MAVVIGVPAEIGEEHKRLTEKVARDAGFGDVECVEEPLGALAFHLNHGDITPAEARCGVVVVDFGGGTLDVAIVRADGLHETWGDPALGGRLFDDLFYQWLADQNKPLEVDRREAMVVWQKECRQLKENFSRHWNATDDSMADFKGHAFVGDRKVRLRDASVAEFQERARCFRLSQIARQYFQGLKGVPNGFVDLAPVDLLEWIRRTVTRGNTIESLKGNFSKVILTGGSSAWPFMRHLAAEAFGVDPDKDIILSQHPETVIGSGLALYNVLKVKNEARRSRLREGKPEAMHQFRSAVAARLDVFAERAAAAVVDTIMPRVENVFWRWYDSGGTLGGVEDDIGTICNTLQKSNEADRILKPHIGDLDTDLVRLLRDHLTRVLEENKSSRDAAHYIPEGSTLANLKVGGRVSDEVAGTLATQLAAAVVAVTTAIVITVLVAIHIKVILISVLIPPILAVLLAADWFLVKLGLGKATKEVEKAVKKWPFGTATLWILHHTMPKDTLQAKLVEGRKKAKADLQADIRSRMGAVSDNTKSFEELVVETFAAVIDAVIADLGILEQIQNR
jgi:hypothetical protein